MRGPPRRGGGHGRPSRDRSWVSGWSTGSPSVPERSRQSHGQFETLTKRGRGWIRPWILPPVPFAPCVTVLTTVPNSQLGRDDGPRRHGPALPPADLVPLPARRPRAAARRTPAGAGGVRHQPPADVP